MSKVNQIYSMYIMCYFVYVTISCINDVRNDFVGPKLTWIDNGIFASCRHDVALKKPRMLFFPRDKAIAFRFLEKLSNRKLFNKTKNSYRTTLNMKFNNEILIFEFTARFVGDYAF